MTDVPAEEQPQGTEPSLSSHERKDLERKERGEQRRKEQESHEAGARKKKLFWRILAGVIILGIAYGFYWSYTTREKPFTAGEVHWHTALEMSICGKHKNLPRVLPGAGHLGEVLLHTHDDDIVHVEGRVYKQEQITLGAFFDAINVPFGEDRFFEKKNNDLCDGKPGKVKMWLDGKESTAFRNLLVLDGQKVKIAFEP